MKMTNEETNEQTKSIIKTKIITTTTTKNKNLKHSKCIIKKEKSKKIFIEKHKISNEMKI